MKRAATKPVELPARIETCISSDQNLYAGLHRNSDHGIDDPSFRKFDAAFGELWSTPCDSTPAGICLHADRIFAHTWNISRDRGVLYCIDDTTGCIRWSQKIKHAEPSPPPHAVGKCLVLPANGKLHAFSTATGKKLWSAAVGQVNFPLFKHPAEEKALLVGGAKGMLHCIDTESGRFLWTTQLSGEEKAQILHAGDTIIAASWGGNLHWLDPQTGKIRQRVRIPVYCTAVENNGTLFFPKPSP